MDTDQARIALTELVASDYLSKVTLHLGGELEAGLAGVASSPRPVCSSDNDVPSNGSSGGEELLHCLNATKVALLLAKAFAKIEDLSQEEIFFGPASLQQLDNFFINFQLEGASKSEGGEKYSEGREELSEKKKAQDNIGDDDLDFDLLISEVLDDDPPEEDLHEKNLDGSERLSEEKKAQDDVGDDDLHFDLLISEVLDDDLPEEDLNGDASPNYCSQSSLTSEVFGIENNCQNAGERTWTIFDISIQPTSNRGLNQGLCDTYLLVQMPLMQILGNHIHAIYSRSSHQILSSIRVREASTPEIEEVILSDQRCAKQRISNRSSLFSTLIESGDYPVAVCRLLSDLIDSSEGGPGGNPFKTLDEVIQDLEQMSNHPQIFLHDQNNGFYSSSLHFGQRCYGRETELAKILEISTRLEQSSGSSESTSPCNVSEAVFVSGVAGSGKSHLVQNVGGFLTNLGWTFVRAKFKREMEHSSREIVSSLFQELVAAITEMAGSNKEDDADYHRRAVEAISDEFDPDNLSCLSNFIPSIKELLPGADINDSILAESDMSLWQLVFLLSKLVRAILSLGRNILLCLDDLQWCDSMMLVLVKEIISSVGRNQKGRRHFLFVGMYRDDEITVSHPFADHLASLKKSQDVHATEINLSSLSRDEISDMIMSEMRLPQRLVLDLADVVHKTTSGHAIFVVQVLNSLVRDSTIAYSPRRHRFDWDENKIAVLRMGDSVASLIVSNLSSLKVEALQSLRVLSCFGIQIPLSLIKLLLGCTCVPKRGIESSLPGLVERGVVEMSGLSVVFSHDLIQQHVYENIPIEERRSLHLEIGTFIASEIALDSSLLTKSAEAGVEGLRLGEAEHDSASTPSYQLIAIATNQINVAGPGSVSDRLNLIRFARWNICAGKDAADRSNFQAALYFYKSGITFLGDRLWLEDSHRLCHELLEGSASAFFAIGDHMLAVQQANAIICNVPFEDSLVAQHILIRALDNLGRCAEAVANGLDLLHMLEIDIPPRPSPSDVAHAMAETGRAVSAYSFDQITNTRHIVDARKRSVMKCVSAVVISFFRSALPYLPLVACAVVNYSLQNGICDESAFAFNLFGYFKVSLEGNYEEGRYWGRVVLKILERAKSQTRATLQTDILCTNYLNFLYFPFKELASRQMGLHQRCLALGEFDIGLYALSFSIMLSYYGGEMLSLILKSMEELIEAMLKHNKEGTKIAFLNKTLVEGLVGNSSGTFPDFGGFIHDEHSLLADAQAKDNIILIEAIHVRRFNSAFWMGDFIEARKCSGQILALPSSKMAKIQLVFHTFYMGLISFQMYRGGEGEEHLEEGKKALDKMKLWSKCSKANFNNKLLLLEAENHASVFDIHAARAAFEASARSARDHGLVQEQGLACELYGKFLSSIVEPNQALLWLKSAHTCYVQWGAVAKAERVWKEHNLDASRDGGFHQFANKHDREW